MFLITLSSAFSIEVAVSEAREAIGMKHDRLAFLMGITGPQLSQQLAQQGHLSLRRLLLVASTDDGKAFWRVFWPLVAAQVGMEDKALAVQLSAFAERFGKLIDAIQIRMVKADLDARDKQEVA